MAKDWHQTEDAKKRISETLKRRIELGEIKKPGPAVGHFVSGETKRKIGLKSAERKHTDETKRKMSLAKQGYVPWNKGKPASLDVKLRLQTMNVGRKHNGEFRRKQSELVRARVIKKGKDYISQVQRQAISLAQKGVNDGPLSDDHKDKISSGVAQAVMNGKYRVTATYDGVDMSDSKEALFAMWCDEKGLRWKYQPLVFFVKPGVRYIPDFLLLDLNEFVEIGELTRQGKPEKMKAFIKAGNVLHTVSDSSDLRKIEQRIKKIVTVVTEK